MASDKDLKKIIHNLELSGNSLIKANALLLELLKQHWPEIQSKLEEHLSNIHHGPTIGLSSKLHTDELEIGSITNDLKKGKLSKKETKALFNRCCTVINLFLFFTDEQEIKGNLQLQKFVERLNKAGSFEELARLLKNDGETLRQFSKISAKLKKAGSRILPKLPEDTRTLSLNALDAIDKACREASPDFTPIVNFVSRNMPAMQERLGSVDISKAYLLLLGFLFIGIGFLYLVLRDFKDLKFDFFDMREGSFVVSLGCILMMLAASASTVPL